MIYGKKEIIILIYKVLSEYTDESHYLTQNEIIDKLYSLYQVEVERKAVSNSITLLQNLDYDIVKNPKGGYALYSRLLDEMEIKYINDALFSSKSISGKQVLNISNKLNSCLSKYQRKRYLYLYKSTNISRSENKELFFNLELIEEAIGKKKKISFKYLGYDENGKRIERYNGFRYVVSPYYLVNNFGKYYVLANYRSKYSPIQNYRLDYLLDIRIEDEDAKDINEIEELKNFDIAEYINEHVYLFSGKVITAKIKIINPIGVQYIYEYYGKNQKLYKENDMLYVNIKSSFDALYYWLLQYGDNFEVIEPDELIVKLIDTYKKQIQKYDK